MKQFFTADELACSRWTCFNFYDFSLLVSWAGLQSQKAAIAYLKSKQLLSFVFQRRCGSQYFIPLHALRLLRQISWYFYFQFWSRRPATHEIIHQSTMTSSQKTTDCLDCNQSLQWLQSKSTNTARYNLSYLAAENDVRIETNATNTRR